MLTQGNAIESLREEGYEQLTKDVAVKATPDGFYYQMWARFNDKLERSETMILQWSDDKVATELCQAWVYKEQVSYQPRLT